MVELIRPSRRGFLSGLAALMAAPVAMKLALLQGVPEATPIVGIDWAKGPDSTIVQTFTRRSWDGEEVVNLNGLFRVPLRVVQANSDVVQQLCGLFEKLGQPRFLGYESLSTPVPLHWFDEEFRLIPNGFLRERF
jgi:hypothetical protein